MKPPQFGADITNQTNNETNLPAVMHCTRMAGRAIIRVVGRCNDAQENNNLDKGRTVGGQRQNENFLNSQACLS
ncbi:hypothetical protein PR048_021571 [Dryococelus australis]|uniref:Uncharacterized protein n=1 Tax=Dryococelus australis TaxID=614101 RepID=A0ABQ9GYS4_9NEOP|nr:hypothetical protein PR048_021571 [Dryococelus australis]